MQDEYKPTSQAMGSNQQILTSDQLNPYIRGLDHLEYSELARMTAKLTKRNADAKSAINEDKSDKFDVMYVFKMHRVKTVGESYMSAVSLVHLFGTELKLLLQAQLTSYLKRKLGVKVKDALLDKENSYIAKIRIYQGEVYMYDDYLCSQWKKLATLKEIEAEVSQYS